jgi:MoxR-vWA-beta-propeller ternary system domain bpX0/MoxR-vWA-beta-propeller ternary system domain bpX1
MSEISNKTILYFNAPKGYFWRWSEKAEIIEWSDGMTIAYRDELISTLRGIVFSCEPKRLGAVLLVLAACRGDWKASARHTILYRLVKVIVQNRGNEYEVVNDGIKDVFAFLDRINALHQNYRVGQGKILLLRQLFAGEINSFKPNALTNYIDEMASGRLDGQLVGLREHSPEHLKADLAPLFRLANQYPDIESLVLKLETGFEVLPEPVEIAEPDEPDALNLLDELSKDAQTAGVAQLTQSLMAALNVPMQTHGASDLPVGGVSDITNRGNFDKLLLSELAQDDDLLTARLVNNEALYLRRETPPANPDRQRVILLDTTIKMWGMSRPFALSSALALSENKKNVAEVNVFALKGMTFDPLSISSKKGVLEALNHLAPALHCGGALEVFMRKMPKNESVDYVFISDADAMSHPNFKIIFNQQKHLLRFLIVVNRVGELQFFEFIKGESKLLNTSKFDLDEMLFPTKKTIKNSIFDKKLIDLTQEEMPAFLYHEPTPLYFPAVNITLNQTNHLFVATVGIIVVTETQRVLFFKNREKGAKEILMFIEKGTYCIGNHDFGEFCILVYRNNDNLLKLYRLNVDRLVVEKIDFSSQIKNIEQVVFESKSFYIRTDSEDYKLSILDTAKLYKQVHVKAFDKTIPSFSLSYNRKLVNRGHSFLQRLKHIYINQKGCISFENYFIDLNTFGEIVLLNNSALSLPMKANFYEKDFFKDDFEVKGLPSNQHIKFYKVTWVDGSVAMLDSRGFLHLKSANSDIPEVTIILLTGKVCACWSSDGFVSGNQYFIPNAEKIISGKHFYEKYIQRFISELEHYEAKV